MIKKRIHSTKDDLRTGLFARLSLILGVIFLILFFIFFTISIFVTAQSTGFIKFLYEVSISDVPSALLAFAIIFIGVGIILSILHKQFVKLSEIAQDVEDAKYDEIDKDE